MSFRTRLAAALGFGGLAAEVAQPESPWATSPAGQFTLDSLYQLGANIRVTEERARRLSVVGRAARIVGGTIQRMPLYATSSAGVRLPLQPSLLIQPERGVPRSTTLKRTARALFFHRATWWVVTERDFYGWPMYVRYVPQADARTDDQGRLIEAFGKPVDPKDVIDFVNPDGGVLYEGDDIIRRSILVERAASHAEQNPVPSIDLHNAGADLPDEEIDKLIERWRTAREKGGIGYTSKTVEAKPLGVQPEQLLINARKTLQLDQARLSDMPAWAVDVELAGTSLNYSNNASRWRDLLNLSAVSNIATIIADRLALPDVTPRTQGVAFDTDQFTRDDMKTRFETYEIGKRADFIDNAQIAEWEGWPAPAAEGNAQ